MSIEIHALIKRRVVGSPTKKAILLYMADAASDDGSGIWVSKGNMALDLEMKSKRTVQTNIADLVEAGIVSEVGQRKCKNGFTVEYRINLNTVSSLPQTRAANAPVPQHIAGALNARVQEMRPTGAGDAPPPVQEMHPNHPLNHNRTLCAADADHTQQLDFDFSGFFDQFADAFPRMGDAEKTEDALRKALGEGTAPAKILVGAKAYAVEQKGNQPRYIKYSENWIEEKRWRQHVTKPVASVDPQKVLEERAKDIQARKPWARTIKVSQAGECITAGLVSVAQCRAAGINV
ncbi:helix-turn-helix domain-containing protein [Pseudophaeobacter sp.]|uniref:helix-turn-helix domain-containing protein n=1 Tax=Pseudophaeobacter sp. TaxID=1971739 RepID=UPI003A97F73C